MVLATLLCCLLATTAHATPTISQPTPTLTARHEISCSAEDVALANFAQALYELIASLNNQHPLTIALHETQTPETSNDEMPPLYRLQPSQVFGTFSCASAQLGQLLPPGQAQILRLFSIVTGAAATLLAKDEEAQEYRKYMEFKAAQTNQPPTKEMGGENNAHNTQENVLPSHSPINAHKLFSHAPNLTHSLMRNALQRALFLDEKALEKARVFLNVEENRPDFSRNIHALHNALAHVSFTLYTLEKARPTRTITHEVSQDFLELQSAETLDEHKAIIARGLASHATCDAFLQTLFNIINTAAQKCVQDTLAAIKNLKREQS
jgi:hypothetical protein